MWEAALHHRVLHSTNGTFHMNEHPSNTLGLRNIPLMEMAHHRAHAGEAHGDKDVFHVEVPIRRDGRLRAKA